MVAVAQELVDQVAIGRVHFHAIETGVDRIAGGSPEVLDERRDLFDAQRAGLGYIFETVGGEGLALGTDRAGRHRHFTFRQQAGVEMRPTCQSSTMRPPSACTASVTVFQAATWSRL